MLRTSYDLGVQKEKKGTTQLNKSRELNFNPKRDFINLAHKAACDRKRERELGKDREKREENGSSSYHQGSTDIQHL